MDVAAPTSTVTLNALELAFAGATAEGAGGTQQAGKIDVDAATQTATLHFARPLARGKHTLAISYSGKIGTQATGLFSLDYDTPAGAPARAVHAVRKLGRAQRDSVVG